MDLFSRASLRSFSTDILDLCLVFFIVRAEKLVIILIFSLNLFLFHKIEVKIALQRHELLVHEREYFIKLKNFILLAKFESIPLTLVTECHTFKMHATLTI